MEDRERVTGGQLKWRIFRLDALVSMPATVLVLYFLGTVLDISADVWKAFAIVVLPYAVVTGVAVDRIRERALRAVYRYLATEAGQKPDRRDTSTISRSFMLDLKST